ncbi:hypothetical protein ZWY2020_036983 [Hordeum vulgare]|nr:hypothetical protein ZWY2020_036983 [Hordeum vulgare]
MSVDAASGEGCVSSSSSMAVKPLVTARDGNGMTGSGKGRGTAAMRKRWRPMESMAAGRGGSRGPCGGGRRTADKARAMQSEAVGKSPSHRVDRPEVSNCALCHHIGFLGPPDWWLHRATEPHRPVGHHGAPTWRFSLSNAIGQPTPFHLPTLSHWFARRASRDPAAPPLEISRRITRTAPPRSSEPWASSWDALRKQARRLEAQLGDQMIAYRKLVSMKSDGSENDIETDIERSLKQLQQVNSQMQTWVSSGGSEVLSHTLTVIWRFCKTLHSLRVKQQHASLLDLRDFDRAKFDVEESGDSEQALLREQAAISRNSGQRSTFGGITTKISNVSSRIPTINHIPHVDQEEEIDGHHHPFLGGVRSARFLCSSTGCQSSRRMFVTAKRHHSVIRNRNDDCSKILSPSCFQLTGLALTLPVLLFFWSS